MACSENLLGMEKSQAEIMMERIRKKIAGLKDTDGVTLAEFWWELPRFYRWTLPVVIPATIAWVTIMLVMDTREFGWFGCRQPWVCEWVIEWWNALW